MNDDEQYELMMENSAIMEERDDIIAEYEELLQRFKGRCLYLEDVNAELKRDKEDAERRAAGWERTARAGFPETMDKFFDWLVKQ